jgi:SAM-dependent methyltransferase
METRSPMTADLDAWVYGDFAPDPESRDLVGLKARWLIEALPASEAPAVLDYGAGEGKHLHLVRQVRPKARLVGVDIRKAHAAVDFEFHQVRSNAPLPFEDGAFDVVVSCDVLEHVEDIDQSLDEISRVLRPGGSFIGFVPAEGGFGPHSFFRLLDPHIYRDTKDHGHAYAKRELIAKLKARFKTVRMRYSYHLLGALLDAVFFASFKIPGLGAKLESFWRGQENSVYRASAAQAAPTAMGRLVQLANRLAYYESLALQGVSAGAMGLHLHVVKD